MPITLAVAQPRIHSFALADNVLAHADLVRAAGARVVVFPELSLTGYEHTAPPVAEDSEALRPLVQACATTGSLALVGAPADGHIAVLAVDGGGARVVYRKMCLTEDEARHFRPGTAPAVLTVDGVRLGLAVCKDTGHPEQAEATAALGIDVYVAGVVQTADRTGVQHGRARAVAAKYDVWAATASFAGPTGEGITDTAGRSGIWRPGGELVVAAGAEPGEFVRAEVG
ncbi:putative amidohydrolase [Crossiella equi]|uniref:Amidohydrolase n=1 Tax=Crossiella equi TaxID=130796 RepID=A0ABS5AAZ3_9PSEU|nr:carbon-nitrogen hydrolase family protein [Crossiella equi]MBP2473741.1 putative amidohydrolase [Crossiella equi]